MDRAAFEQWAESYALKHEPNYSKQTEADCWAAWQAATLAERERCACVADTFFALYGLRSAGAEKNAVAAAIRG